MKRIIWRVRGGVKRASSALLGALAIALLKTLRLINPERMADFGGRLMRIIGPIMRENRIGRENLVAAFPEKSSAEIDAILRGVWDNLGRMGAEFANLDRLWDFDPAHPERGRVTGDQTNIERFLRLRDDGKPALIFGAHLANWELPGI